MHDIVINTGPLIALVAATGTLDWLPALYRKVAIPHEVIAEISAGGPGNPESSALLAITGAVHLLDPAKPISLALIQELDLGEASVIHAALEHGILTVAIDEKAGRRVARLHGLKVTGSLGILLKAKKHGHIHSLAPCIARMRDHGIWISAELLRQALIAAKES